MLAMKFGGTSVKDLAAMSQAIDIVKTETGVKALVVLSACAGVTDAILKAVDEAAEGNAGISASALGKLGKRHKELAADIINDNNLRDEALGKVDSLIGELRRLAEGVSLLREVTPKTKDAALAYGEVLSSTIFDFACRARNLNSVFLDARKIMKTDSTHTNANIIFPEIETAARDYLFPLFKKFDVVITQGFIGADKYGNTTTLGRGGSDYSAAVFGAAIGADEIQIWTDVSGVLTADPRLAENTSTLPRLTFSEVRELSFFGAKVLHPDAIKPAVDKNIPVRILNTFQPENPGTLIIGGETGNASGINALTLKEDCLLATYNPKAYEDAAAAFSQTLLELSGSGVKIYSAALADNHFKIIADKSQDTGLGIWGNNVKCVEISLLVFCGNNLASDNGALSKISAISGGIVPLFLLHGITQNSIIAGYESEKGIGALRAAHESLFGLLRRIP